MATTTMVFNHPEYGKLTTKIRDGEIYLKVNDMIVLFDDGNPTDMEEVMLQIKASWADFFEINEKMFANAKYLELLTNIIENSLVLPCALYNTASLIYRKHHLQEYKSWIQDYVVPKAKAYKEGYQNKPKVEKESKTCSCGGKCKDKTLENKVAELEKEISSLKEELKALKPIADMINKIKSIGKI